MPFKKWISYVFPLVEHRQPSEVNEELEVRWESGKKVLNSKNSNYSFGSLHKVFQDSLSHIDFSPQNIDSILILGFGAGSIYKIIRDEYGGDNPITAVDSDKSLKEIMPHFLPQGLENCELNFQDAFEFLKNSNSTYDLILCDLFIDHQVLISSMSEEFVSEIYSHLNLGGTYMHNTMLSDAIDERDYFILLENLFLEVDLLRLQENNSVFIAVKTN